ncbi:HutD family protein [Fulvivirga sp. 29W222]|uniref:HutD family protein n=1 Tax=Fulvivirga marina TaxID=2494733 RepID=A0A937FW90_9BACT|nr:HutD family protein [Fulvivirga marina]MBL6445643.1 HutD family protein [Fulvivirga marina]
MSIKVLNQSQFTTTSWAGGTTTELLIYPEDSTYKALNFDFRLSIATVNTEKSVFTPLPSVCRTLMVLDGNLELIHEGHHSTKLGKFEFDSFLGDWTTTSLGKAKNFNLMTTQGSEGKLARMKLSPGECIKVARNSWYIYNLLCTFRLTGS